MQKGQLTRSAIIAQAFDTATRIGFEQLSLAELAASTDMSKSGLYAHFKSKEALQQAVLELAIERFTAMVVQPALRQPRGVPRLRALFEGQLEWIGSTDSGGRCLFMALGQEYRDRPGVIRDMLVRALKDWNGIVVRVAADAIQDGSLGADEEPRQIAFEMAGIVMAFQQSLKMLGRADAQAMARRAFQSLVTRGKRTA
ncbi:Transcriptional regulator [Cupriavidus gilardii CR3]|uniref:TetR/AcrR family transcriptional regulator n=1 Tax=Cupriavidus gilardii TaxID=82541 RepID=A0A6N1BBI5_9BURK|nr:TetR/AcrR family transcriptional regulator [Cupriavidus gilardii]ALD93294.1 Transcriptional regulator [Cupriavidus gilardii CR3]KAB0599302.1 TetR/AcrR family transcriptional regulator [Cupriavidus gilardii]MCT9013228.1 TetR/AcrR family transcriptional regulator [Cupriavidus gilardii]MCT9052782.1 TetR/AcrR family transcriptional regulator [Cupriavidus gilardii]MCT9070588.1 TetR/AcrR family transcriptional regulator [Cupriavidus gilardii]